MDRYILAACARIACDKKARSDVGAGIMLVMRWYRKAAEVGLAIHDLLTGCSIYLRPRQWTLDRFLKAVHKFVGRNAQSFGHPVPIGQQARNDSSVTFVRARKECRLFPIESIGNGGNLEGQRRARFGNCESPATRKVE
jgi:hypothetical protein